MVFSTNPGCNCCTTCAPYSDSVGKCPPAYAPIDWYVWAIRVLGSTNKCDPFGASGSPTSDIDVRLLFFTHSDTDYWYFSREGRSDGIAFFGAIKKGTEATSTYCEWIEAQDENNGNLVLARWERDDSLSPNKMTLVSVDASCNNDCPTLNLNPRKSGAVIGGCLSGATYEFGGLMAHPRLIPESTTSVDLTFTGIAGSATCIAANGSYTVPFLNGTVWDGYLVASQWERFYYDPFPTDVLCRAQIGPICETATSFFACTKSSNNAYMAAQANASNSVLIQRASNQMRFRLVDPLSTIRTPLSPIAVAEFVNCEPSFSTCTGGTIVTFTN